MSGCFCSTLNGLSFTDPRSCFTWTFNCSFSVWLVWSWQLEIGEIWNHYRKINLGLCRAFKAQVHHHYQGDQCESQYFNLVYSLHVGQNHPTCSSIKSLSCLYNVAMIQFCNVARTMLMRTLQWQGICAPLATWSQVHVWPDKVVFPQFHFRSKNVFIKEDRQPEPPSDF